MLLDLTLPLKSEWIDNMIVHPSEPFDGHIGTHTDVMDKAFPLAYFRREGLLYDVTAICDSRDIEVSDVDLSQVKPDMFVMFYSGFSAMHDYQSFTYLKKHPQLSDALIAALLNRNISMIGLDFAGIRRPPEHHPNDVLCASYGTFVIENLYNLEALAKRGTHFTAYTMPLSWPKEYTGLPCRVLAEV